ncbi:hypothetical protein VNO77_03038 [Canavalia gladiata]|uniref:Uncharacterized protein n=1 Tax=Canavalia gladiata TaxID=3824 RepID=A0AAN9MU27_CANGL
MAWIGFEPQTGRRMHFHPTTNPSPPLSFQYPDFILRQTKRTWGYLPRIRMWIGSYKCTLLILVHMRTNLTRAFSIMVKAGFYFLSTTAARSHPRFRICYPTSASSPSVLARCLSFSLWSRLRTCWERPYSVMATALKE